MKSRPNLAASRQLMQGGGVAARGESAGSEKHYERARLTQGRNSGAEGRMLNYEQMNWAAIAAVLLALAVTLGAFGAHGLRARLDAYSMDVYQKAVFYHFIHALGLLVVSL